MARTYYLNMRFKNNRPIYSHSFPPVKFHSIMDFSNMMEPGKFSENGGQSINLDKNNFNNKEKIIQMYNSDIGYPMNYTNNDLTISFWMKINHLVTAPYANSKIFNIKNTKSDGNTFVLEVMTSLYYDPSIILWAQAVNRPTIICMNYGANSSYISNGCVTIPAAYANTVDNNFHHILITKKAGTNKFFIYKDGQYRNSANIGVPSKASYMEKIQLFNMQDTPYTGIIDDLCIYTGELYHTGTTNYTVPTTYMSDYLGDTLTWYDPLNIKDKLYVY